MHRFYLPPENCRGNALRLDGREAHHALHVLRLKRGDAVTVLDGVGNEFSCEVENAARDSLALTVKEKKNTPPLPCAITLLQAVPKGKIIEGIIQKSVELGAWRIVPILSERVVTQLGGDDAEKKRDKWQQVAIEAIKQCGATWLPRVEAPVTIEQFIARAEKFDLQLVGSLQPERRHPREVLREFETKHGCLPHSVGVWIGPEGDFTLDELKAIQAAGALPISMGQLVLRVETATIYCLSFLNYELNQ
ncbi:MAG: RsmE family RNA methyltransferase [Verrucomicrobiales bacterium]|nr:RsmE family RNA methyltransferase [Verrucomicrobiales bacterium]